MNGIIRILHSGLYPGYLLFQFVAWFAVAMDIFVLSVVPYRETAEKFWDIGKLMIAVLLYRWPINFPSSDQYQGSFFKYRKSVCIGKINKIPLGCMFPLYVPSLGVLVHLMWVVSKYRIPHLNSPLTITATLILIQPSFEFMPFGMHNYGLLLKVITDHTDITIHF